MFPHVGWPEILLRLVLTLIAGAVIGSNRGERGRAAGLRTTMLVCLAASLSMVQVNLLLAMNGKSPSSFVVMDLMRLPLGILTGVGFIGAGSILKKGDLVKGVTTAATLWYVTVIGLCLGGGQLILGLIGTMLGWIILSALKSVEKRWHQEHWGKLTLLCDETGPQCEEVRRSIEAVGAKVIRWLYFQQGCEKGHREQTCEVKWKASLHELGLPPFVQKLSEDKGVLQIKWEL